MNYEHRDKYLGSWNWLAAASELPAMVLPVRSLSAGGQLFTGRCIFRGYSLANVATTAGQFAVLDGQDATGITAAISDVAASSSTYDNPAVKGVLMDLGIYLAITTATLTGALWIVPLWDYPHTMPGR